MNIIREFLTQAVAHGSKSTVIKPIGWLVGVGFSALLISFYFKFDFWLKLFFVITTSIFIVLFIVSYFYCLFKNPEFLRSEKYSIQKLAIEKGLVGDDKTGLFLSEFIDKKKSDKANSVENEDQE